MSSSSSASASSFNNKTDYCSQSNPDKVTVCHIDIKWNVNFDKMVIGGTVTHTLYVKDVPSTSWEAVQFDSKNLTLSAVTVNGVANAFQVGEVKIPAIGSCVSVPIAESLRQIGTKLTIAITYTCGAEASAVQWLDPAATKGGKHPYVFTQCQAIHARSLLPCMDSPGVKSTYSAEVTCPDWCTVLMSALAQPGEVAPSDVSITSPTPKAGNKKNNKKKDQKEAPVPAASGGGAAKKSNVFKFYQPLAVPCYLIALAAGNLASRDLSPRCAVWSEPEVVDAAATEFSDTETFLQVAESLTCPYPWTRYDILCMPPSFPYGGMENPCLTFATPTLLAGDKSLANVIAHEIAHSWTGNLVTNHTWEHFWLNEGWTVWLERKIMAGFYKSDEYALMSAEGGWKDLSDSVKDYGVEHKFTRLICPLENEDPDDAFSSIPYEKGFNTLNYLEGLVGSPAFLEFAKHYINTFKGLSVTSGEFRDCFLGHFSSSAVKLADINWESLLHDPGMFFQKPNFSNSLSVKSIALAESWIAYSQATDSKKSSSTPQKVPSAVSKADFATWSTMQKTIFLEKLLIHTEGEGVAPFSLALLEKLDKTYDLTSYGNAEVKKLWQVICLDSNAPWIVEHVVAFITSQGRMKFVGPLYKALRHSTVGATKAVETFGKFSGMYHPIARGKLTKMFEAAKQLDDAAAATAAAPEKTEVESKKKKAAEEKAAAAEAERLKVESEKKKAAGKKKEQDDLEAEKKRAATAAAAAAKKEKEEKERQEREERERKNEKERQDAEIAAKAKTVRELEEAAKAAAKKLKSTTAAATAATTTATTTSAVAVERPAGLMYNKVDKCSNSNPDKVTVSHIDIKWNVNFDKKVIGGTVTHTLYVNDVSSTSWEAVQFDSRDLLLEKVSVNGIESPFQVGASKPAIGSCVSVPIAESLRQIGTKLTIAITYTCGAEASAVQWLDPAATKGGKHPYVFTQCQAIHARSLLPCMDSPGVKSTYRAEVTCPDWCTVLMSALGVKEELPKGVFKFKQDVNVPCYLIALAAGNLASRDLSPRCAVWSEPEVVDAAAFEFSDTETFLKAAESITCPYPWTRYDILCLPPSFPYGGMENPCLTFATPTLLAGDKSLADVIAHEIAHSWTGNLVTNHTWEHFWLNEGWTVWLERKIMAVAKNNDEYSKLSAELGWQGLKDEVSMRESNNEHAYTHLVNPLGEGDPDDAFGRVPYEKGFNTLNYLEGLVSTPEFLKFVKFYIAKFQFSSTTSGDFKDTFQTYFSGNAAIAGIDWNHLYHTSGNFFQTPDFSNSLSKNAKSLADSWVAYIEGGNNTGAVANASGVVVMPSKVSKAEFDSWSSQQKSIFLQTLQVYSSNRETEIPLSYLESIDKAYSLTAYVNAEVKFLWQRLCLDNEAPWIVEHAVNFVTSQGRMKFVRPLYKALRHSKVGKEASLATFAKFENVYHPICKKMVSKDFAAADEHDKQSQVSTATSSASSSSDVDGSASATGGGGGVKGDTWMVIHGKVYDVEKLLADHPGGEEVLKETLKTDATRAFEEVGHSPGARKWLEEFYVADASVASDVSSTSTAAPVPAPPTVVKDETKTPVTTTVASAPVSSTGSSSSAAASPSDADNSSDSSSSSSSSSSSTWVIIGGVAAAAIGLFAFIRSRK